MRSEPERDKLCRVTVRHRTVVRHAVSRVSVTEYSDTHCITSFYHIDFALEQLISPISLGYTRSIFIANVSAG